MEEIWKDIAGYEGWYQVSNLGRVKSIKRKMVNRGNVRIIETERLLRFSVHGKGYYCVRLAPVFDGYTKKSFDVHRLVAKAFIDNPNDYKQVDHINKDKTDNRVENLRWVTNQMNQLNTKRNVNITAFGETKCISEWSREYGISTNAIKTRIQKHKMKPEYALTIPATTGKNRKSVQMFYGTE